MSDWCILRTKAAHTLVLAESLRGGGFEAWTPVERLRRRIPRRRSVEEGIAPMLPTFVFGGVASLLDLLALADSPQYTGHPDFSVFHYFGSVPLVDDGDLDPLRAVEAMVNLRHRRKQKCRTFAPGETVQATDGAWAGKSGIVERDSGKFVLVTFDRREVKIAKFLLAEEERRAA